jgi:hypothetical protein
LTEQFDGGSNPPMPSHNDVLAALGTLLTEYARINTLLDRVNGRLTAAEREQKAGQQPDCTTASAACTSANGGAIKTELERGGAKSAHARKLAEISRKNSLASGVGHRRADPRNSMGCSVENVV